MAEYKFEKLFFITVIVFTFGFNILTVNAFKCHQCNSFADPDCDDLQENLESVILSDKYLKDCSVASNETTIFCRKTSYFINYDQSSRIVRACGWLKERTVEPKKMRRSCISADNEGFTETICVCDTDGCNSADRIYFAQNSKLLYSICLSVVLVFLKKFYI